MSGPPPVCKTQESVILTFKEYLSFVTFLQCFQPRINIKQKYWDRFGVNKMRLPSISEQLYLACACSRISLILILRKFADNFAVFDDSEIAKKRRITLPLMIATQKVGTKRKVGRKIYKVSKSNHQFVRNNGSKNNSERILQALSPYSVSLILSYLLPPHNQLI